MRLAGIHRLLGVEKRRDLLLVQDVGIFLLMRCGELALGRTELIRHGIFAEDADGHTVLGERTKMRQVQIRCHDGPAAVLYERDDRLRAELREAVLLHALAEAAERAGVGFDGRLRPLVAAHLRGEHSDNLIVIFKHLRDLLLLYALYAGQTGVLQPPPEEKFSSEPPNESATISFSRAAMSSER